MQRAAEAWRGWGLWRRRGRAMCTMTCHALEPENKSTRISILSNGVRVATEFRAEPYATVALVVEAGSRYEPPHYNGITNVVEHMAYKGFSSRMQPFLDHHLRCMGAALDADTQREQQTFTGRVLPEYVPDVMDTLSLILTDLFLDDAVLECEKRTIRRQLWDAERDPRAVCFDYLHQTAFQGTPLAQTVGGTSANIERFQRSDVCDFLRQHYQPYKLCIVSSGFVEHEAMVAWTDARFGHLRGDKHCQSQDGPCRFTGSQIVYRDDSMPYAHVAIAFQAPGYGSPDYLRMLVAMCMLGSWDRSRGGGNNNNWYLARASACADFCERYEAFYLPYRDVGLWGVYFVGHPQYLDEMMGAVQGELMKLSQVATYGHVEFGKSQAQLLLARRALGAAASVRDIGTELLYTCARSTYEEKAAKICCLEGSTIMAACKDMLYDRSPAVAAVGPTEVLPDYTRIAAGQYWLRL